MIAGATQPYIIREPPALRRWWNIRAASTGTTHFLPALNELLTLDNENGYTFQACLHAHSHAEGYLEAATALLGNEFPSPEFMPDGEGGIDIEWNKNARKLTLSCRGSISQNDYIYWEENGVYDAKDFSLGLLKNKLDWLNRG